MRYSSTFRIILVVLAVLSTTACRVRQCDVLYDGFSPIIAPDGVADGFTTETANGEILTLMIIGDLLNPNPLPLNPLLGGVPGLGFPGGPRRPQGYDADLQIGLSYVRLNDIDITLDATKTAIEDTDYLDYRVVWRRPLTQAARTQLADTFEFVEFPNDFVLRYAGPAPQGFDLAAVIGIRQAEVRVDSADIELTGGEEWPSLISEFQVTIDPDVDTVMINGVTALTLSEDAHVLD